MPETLTLLINPARETTELDGVPCRIWHGRDNQGRRYLVYVHRVATNDRAAQEQLERVLGEMPSPQSGGPDPDADLKWVAQARAALGLSPRPPASPRQGFNLPGWEDRFVRTVLGAADALACPDGLERTSRSINVIITHAGLMAELVEHLARTSDYGAELLDLVAAARVAFPQKEGG